MSLDPSTTGMPEVRQPDDGRRRLILGGGAGLLLAGCGHLGSVELMSQTIGRVGEGRGRDYPRSREQIDALPYAQLGVARGDGPRAVLLLAEARGGEWSWISGDRVQIVTRGHRVVRTTGLRSDLRETWLDGPDLCERYQLPGGTIDAAPLVRRIRVEPGREGPVRIESRLRAEGIERIEIHGRTVEALRVVEDLDMPAWRWKARNLWWLDRGSPLVWRSVQHLTPDQPPLHLELLKRPT